MEARQHEMRHRAGIILQEPGPERDDIRRGELMQTLLPGIGFDDPRPVRVTLQRKARHRIAPVAALLLTDESSAFRDPVGHGNNARTW